MNFIITVSIILVGVLWVGMMFGSFFVKLIESIFHRNKNKKRKPVSSRH